MDSVHQDINRLEGAARLRAARRLARQGHDDVASTLVSLLTQDKNPDVRNLAAAGLGRIGTKQAAAALKKALVDNDRTVRRRAIFELGKIGGYEAALALGAVLSHDPDASVRRFAAHTLARLDSVAARSALEAAEADPENTARAAAGAALAEWQKSFQDSN